VLTAGGVAVQEGVGGATHTGGGEATQVGGGEATQVGGGEATAGVGGATHTGGGEAVQVGGGREAVQMGGGEDSVGGGVGKVGHLHLHCSQTAHVSLLLSVLQASAQSGDRATKSPASSPAHGNRCKRGQRGEET